MHISQKTNQDTTYISVKYTDKVSVRKNQNDAFSKSWQKKDLMLVSHTDASQKKHLQGNFYHGEIRVEDMEKNPLVGDSVELRSSRPVTIYDRNAPTPQSHTVDRAHSVLLKTNGNGKVLFSMLADDVVAPTFYYRVFHDVKLGSGTMKPVQDVPWIVATLDQFSSKRMSETDESALEKNNLLPNNIKNNADVKGKYIQSFQKVGAAFQNEHQEQPRLFALKDQGGLSPLNHVRKLEKPKQMLKASAVEPVVLTYNVAKKSVTTGGPPKLLL